jgi:hypothetical protein
VRWHEEKSKQEKDSNKMNKLNTNPSLVLQANNILCGRGSSQFTGNIAFRRIVDSMQKCYEEAPVGGKRDMSEKIVESIRKESKGRFLSRDTRTGELTELNNEKSAKKVAQRFDSLRNQIMRRKNNLAKRKASGRITPVTPLLVPQANDVLCDTNSRNGIFSKTQKGMSLL